MTVYVVAGVTSTFCSGASVVAAAVPGRVGVKRTPVDDDAVAGASGLKLGGGFPIGIETVLVERGTETVGPPLGGKVSLGAGMGRFAVELQPGFAKISISAKTWMPITTPKIFRIFMVNAE
jgi:hypothetical protein